jgi:hypothetical protein
MNGWRYICNDADGGLVISSRDGEHCREEEREREDAALTRQKNLLEK